MACFSISAEVYHIPRAEMPQRVLQALFKHFRPELSLYGEGVNRLRFALKCMRSTTCPNTASHCSLGEGPKPSS